MVLLWVGAAIWLVMAAGIYGWLFWLQRNMTVSLSRLDDDEVYHDPDPEDS